LAAFRLMRQASGSLLRQVPPLLGRGWRRHEAKKSGKEVHTLHLLDPYWGAGAPFVDTGSFGTGRHQKPNRAVLPAWHDVNRVWLLGHGLPGAANPGTNKNHDMEEDAS